MKQKYLWDMDWNHSFASEGFPVKAHEPRVVLYIICATLQHAKTLGWVVHKQAFHKISKLLQKGASMLCICCHLLQTELGGWTPCGLPELAHL